MSWGKRARARCDRGKERAAAESREHGEEVRRSEANSAPGVVAVGSSRRRRGGRREGLEIGRAHV